VVFYLYFYGSSLGFARRGCPVMRSPVYVCSCPFVVKFFAKTARPAPKFEEFAENLRKICGLPLHNFKFYDKLV
jgi:hypothetical protein